MVLVFSFDKGTRHGTMDLSGVFDCLIEYLFDVRMSLYFWEVLSWEMYEYLLFGVDDFLLLNTG